MSRQYLFVRGDAVSHGSQDPGIGVAVCTGVVSHLASQIIVPFLALAMYRLLRPVNKEHAIMMAALASLCVPVSFMSEVNSLAALRLLGGSDQGVFTSAQLQFQAMLFLDMRNSGVLLGQVFWGLWLIILGSLVFRSGFLPRALGVAVMIGAAGYLVDSGMHLILPGRPTVSQFTALGELMLPIWLLAKGVTVQTRNDAELA